MTTPIAIKAFRKRITMEDPKLKIRKITVEPNPGKVLMLVGARGAGKSTLINGMANYIMGVQYEDGFRYKLVEDEETSAQAKTQNNWITTYTFNKQDHEKLPNTITIIDTPDYGDTEGLGKDEQIIEEIKEFFSLEGPEGIDHLNGIGFVVPASLPRLSTAQNDMFHSILSIFGEGFSKNIFLMVTSADGSKPPVLAAIKEAKLKTFKFNNSALFTETENDNSDDDEGDIVSFNSMFWKMGERSIENFFKTFNRAESVSLQLTKEVLNKRENLEDIIQLTRQKVEEGLHIADQLYQEEEMLKQCEAHLMENKDFVYQVKVTKQRKVHIVDGKNVTNCLKCHMTCHYPCNIARNEDKKGCIAMKGTSNCKVCPGKCFWNHHVNNPYRFELYIEEETRTFEDLKKRYYEAASKKTAAENVKAGFKKDLDNLYLTVLGLLRKAHRIIHRLEELDQELDKKPNPLSEIQYIELFIDVEKMQKKRGFERRIEALENVLGQAKKFTEMDDEEKVTQMLKEAADHCRNKLQFW